MIKYYKPFITKSEHDAVKRVLDSGWLSTGAEVKAFEEEFAEAHGCKHALAVSSATAGLHLAMSCSPYIECKITNYTFIATLEAALRAGKKVRLLGATDGYNVTFQPEDYGTLVPVHIGGELVDLSQNKSSRAFVVEDCAHRFPGGTYERGVIQVFSFYANKPIACGEGGMICTDNTDYYERMREVYYHGMDKTRYERGNGSYSVTKIGNKYNMSDIHAAIGREQLKNLDLLSGRRQEIADKYIDAFTGSKTVITRPKNKANSWHLFMIQLATKELADTVRSALDDAEIEYGRHYQPLTTWECVREAVRFDDGIHKRDADLYERSISLPIYVDLTDKEQCAIIETVKKAIE